MTYNFAGVISHLFIFGIKFIVLGAIVLLLSSFWNAEKRIKKGIWIGIGCLLLGIAYTIYYLSILLNPSIGCFVGCLENYQQTSRVAPLTFQYIFCTDTEKVFLDLDIFASKKIFSDGVAIKGQQYKVYYEERSNIIVGIEQK